MIVDKILEYIKTCPYFTKNDMITTDYLAEEPTNYSVESAPCEKIITEYIDGSTERQLEFYLTGREVAGAFAEGNIENTLFYERFSNWIEENNKKSILPKLALPLEALSIETLSPAYVIQIDADRARYVVHMRFTYYCKI